MSARAARSAALRRDTKETQIAVKIGLDGTGASKFDTGIPFLEQIC